MSSGCISQFFNFITVVWCNRVENDSQSNKDMMLFLNKLAFVWYNRVELIVKVIRI